MTDIDAEIEAHIPVPDIAGEGDYLFRSGHDFPERSVLAGDVMVVKEQDHAEDGQLVVTLIEKRPKLVQCEPGVAVSGLVVGLMRRIDG